MLPFPCTRVAAPMVGCSDLAFRLLARRHGCDLAYTEMLFSERIVSDDAYLQRRLQSCAEDRPLAVQLCGNEPATLAAAAKRVEEHADAVCLNLGCPLPNAEAGRFGAYLLDRSQWSGVCAMIRAMCAAVAVPVLCKIRLLPDLGETIELCRALRDAGCSLIAVHGRQRPPARRHRGQREEQADLASIRAIVEALDPLPVLSNGNTACSADVERNLAYTRAAGLMSAEGLLRNPALFSTSRGRGDEEEEAALPREAAGELAHEYLRLAALFPPPELSWAASHVMWMMGKQGKGEQATFAHLGPYSSPQLRLALVGAQSIAELHALVSACTGVAACEEEAMVK